jgi:hypothetical protein
MRPSTPLALPILPAGQITISPLNVIAVASRYVSSAVRTPSQ